jgi:hypothetical protein
MHPKSKRVSLNFRSSSVAVLVFSSVVGAVACGDDGEGDGGGGGSGNTPNRPDETGAACEMPDDCYPDVADGDLQGEAVCITRVRDGYCTHTCQADTDCCAADGECKSGLVEVCSPFESMEGMNCFVSCESADVEAAGVADEQEYCQKNASPDFICRSSGGGSSNRKICVPGDCSVGADCDDATDCASGLECAGDARGGYCTVNDCTTNAECPGDSLCVARAGGASRCYRPCASASDCSFCRSDAFATCSDDVTFAEDGTTGSVCIPG